MRKIASYLFTCLVALGCNDKPELTPSGTVDMYVFPNPTSGPAEVRVRNTSSQPYQLLVFNPEGKKILGFSLSPGEQRVTLLLRDEPKGNYQVVVDTPTGATRRKLVKL